MSNEEGFDVGQSQGAFDTAIRNAAQQMRDRQSGAVDDAIAALIVAGVSLDDVEILVSASGGATVVRKRRGPPPEVGQHSGYYP